ncbi:AMP-binding protein [Alteromonas gilva]|uniref:AMP-binding protein n=1 Tax=Alteromonas gilva TaxID=2987522 RepID=A0ABT5L071_9ALTE|nr:AMP-binding protein [Alteromonas gilva]MDC8829282.1 AMP-binding protein [Alteromonas gilva]
MILQNWQQWPERIALEWSGGRLCYAGLQEAIQRTACWLSTQPVKRIALMADNCPDWVICDLACRQTNKVLVPIPPYFSLAQREHLLEQAGIELVVTDQPEQFAFDEVRAMPLMQLTALKRVTTTAPQLPVGAGKVTFTSGSTGNPKGVCLSNVAQARVARSLDDALPFSCIRHQCLLPLATLLENIAGIYAPLLIGGTVILSSAEELGFTGARLTNPAAVVSAITKAQPESLIVVPELLMLLVTAIDNGWQAPSSLKFIAVGGARVSPDVIARARAAGLPVYQGYGLSECVSVNTLNVPGAERIDTVGRSLGHNQLYVENGELVISGEVFLGYMNQPSSFYPTHVYTGDLVAEKHGFYTIHGRKKHLIITSLGRNISPEWLESELLAGGLFSHVLVVGEARPVCGAVLVPRNAAISQAYIGQYLADVNRTLPEYARIHVWRIAKDIATGGNLFTSNGKLRREQALAFFEPLITDMYTPAIA